MNLDVLVLILKFHTHLGKLSTLSLDTLLCKKIVQTATVARASHEVRHIQKMKLSVSLISLRGITFFYRSDSQNVLKSIPQYQKGLL